MYDPMTDPRLEEIQSYKGRLTEFLKLDGLSSFENMKILVPGSALGGECFAALELGAREVTGLEIFGELVLESKKYATSRDATNVTFLEFDGRKFPNHGYDLVLSGHVIEHSPDWREHLNECIKATRLQGRVYLEFPSRYHFKELHTGLISFEWLPSSVRKLLNLSSAKIYELLGKHEKSLARHAIQDTLQQVSERQISRYIRRRFGNSILVRRSSNPVPGIVRLIIS
jgi:SAM-dependent methyltransferase